MYNINSMRYKGKWTVLLVLSVLINTICFGQNINRSVSKDISDSALGLDYSGQKGSETIPGSSNTN